MAVNYKYPQALPFLYNDYIIISYNFTFKIEGIF